MPFQIRPAKSVTRTRKGQMLLENFQNKNFENDEQILHCRCRENPVSTDRRDRVFDLKQSVFRPIKMRERRLRILKKRLYIDFPIEHLSISNKNHSSYERIYYIFNFDTK